MAARKGVGGVPRLGDPCSQTTHVVHFHEGRMKVETSGGSGGSWQP